MVKSRALEHVLGLSACDAAGSRNKGALLSIYRQQGKGNV